MALNTLRFTSFLLVFMLFLSCNEEEKVPPPYQPTDAYDAYLFGLRETGIIQTALGSEWQLAGDHALKNPVDVPVPYSEAFFLPSETPESLGLKFEAKRGQVINIKIDGVNDSTFLFIDLFRIENDSLSQYHHVATADSAFHELKFEPRKDAEYILRILPEILRGGKFTLTIQNLPLLAFPVTGKNKWAIQSKFGAPREGGRREHHGVDIFARRHTPIIAPIDGYIREVDTAKLGGRVVWLRDIERGNSLYFAHLQEQWVKEGDQVMAGDTIGTVGNTGNAKTTPPHLHFGIYSRGPVDPYYFIVAEDTLVDPIKAEVKNLGKWIRTRQKVSLRTRYGSKFEVVRDYEPHSILYVEGVVGNYYRVRQVDGVMGYVLARVTERADQALDEIAITETMNISQLPGDSEVSFTIDPGDTLKVLGIHDSFKLVMTSSGSLGWTAGD